jgi:hypothetical protein
VTILLDAGQAELKDLILGCRLPDIEVFLLQTWLRSLVMTSIWTIVWIHGDATLLDIDGDKGGYADVPQHLWQKMEEVVFVYVHDENVKRKTFREK